MSGSLIPVQSENGWVIEMTPEMAQLAGVAEGSVIAFYLSEGAVMAEILPPSPELRQETQRIGSKLKDVFAEMKRLGD